MSTADLYDTSTNYGWNRAYEESMRALAASSGGMMSGVAVRAEVMRALGPCPAPGVYLAGGGLRVDVEDGGWIRVVGGTHLYAPQDMERFAEAILERTAWARTHATPGD